MECKHCGAILSQEDVFCGHCGKRVDGMKVCSNCNNLIRETVTYCTFCGTRVDGKKVCANCGEIIENNFCPKCGSVAKGTKQRSKTSFDKIVNLVNPILYLCSFIIIFVCSFFIGTNVLGIKTSDIFYYFSDCFTTNSAALGKLVSPGTDMYTYGLNMLNISSVICLIVIILNFIIQILAIVFGSINFAKKIKNKPHVAIYKFVTLSFVSFLFTAITLFQDQYAVVKVETIEVALHMSVGSLFGIIGGGILILTTVVLHLINNRKEFTTIKYLKIFVPTSIAMVFSFLGLVLSHSSLSINNNTLSGTFSSWSTLREIICAIVVKPKAYTYNSFTLICVFNFIFNFLLLVALSISMKLLIDNLYERKNKFKLTFISLIVSAVLSIVNLILVILIKSKTLSFSSTSAQASAFISFSPIVVLIFAIIALASIITALVINRTNENVN